MSRIERGIAGRTPPATRSTNKRGAPYGTQRHAKHGCVRRKIRTGGRLRLTNHRAPDVVYEANQSGTLILPAQHWVGVNKKVVNVNV